MEKVRYHTRLARIQSKLIYLWTDNSVNGLETKWLAVKEHILYIATFAICDITTNSNKCQFNFNLIKV